MIKVEGVERELDRDEIIRQIIIQIEGDYSGDDYHKITNALVRFLNDLEYDSNILKNMSVEEYYVGVLNNYFKDNHTIDDFLNLEDDLEFFDYA